MNWLFRDPLRGISLDKFPYPRNEGEIELDFIFKAMIYLPSWILCLLFSEFAALGMVGFWVIVNFLRKDK